MNEDFILIKELCKPSDVIPPKAPKNSFKRLLMLTNSNYICVEGLLSENLQAYLVTYLFNWESNERFE